MLVPVLFYALAAFALASGVLVVTARNAVHSVLFLVANFLGVAVLYVVMGAAFLAVIQILVYAGGIVVLYLFVVMLVSVKRPEGPVGKRRQSQLGFALAAVMLAEISAILVYSAGHPVRAIPAPQVPAAVNTEFAGTLLYTDYLVPFEVASMLVLAAIVGAIVLAKAER